jgi:hypothetical protein
VTLVEVHCGDDRRQGLILRLVDLGLIDLGRRKIRLICGGKVSKFGIFE